MTSAFDKAPRIVEPRAREVEPRRDADSDDKTVDGSHEEHDEFSSDLKDAKDKPDGTRGAQEMLAAGTLVKPSPVRQATFVPPAPKASSTSPLEAAVSSLLDQLHAITQRIGVAAQQALAAQTTTSVTTITATVEDLDDQHEEKSTKPEPRPEGAFKLDAQMHLEPMQAPKGPVATTGVREPAPLPDAPTSHMHLVVGEGDQRMVVTVAVRGDQVTTTVRGGDEQMQAALARNAASLDHAMHTKGLDLSSFTAERDTADHHQNQHEAPEREEEAHEQFRLEEILK